MKRYRVMSHTVGECGGHDFENTQVHSFHCSQQANAKFEQLVETEMRVTLWDVQHDAVLRCGGRS